MDVNAKFGDARRTEINYSDDEISMEDLIPNEQVAITISHAGYIKRTKLIEYKQQNRGGRGSRGSKTKVEDYVEHLLIGYSHNHMLVFTGQGRCFWLRVFDIPEATKTSLGKAVQNIIQIPSDDKIKAYILVESISNKEFLDSHSLIFCTKKGIIKKTILEAFSRPRANGINAITINEGDELLEVRLTNGSNEIILANRKGRAIRFSEKDVRDMGRNAAGVGGMKLDKEDDEVVGMITVDPSDPTTTIFVASEKGNGKRSNLDDYRVTKRKGKGVKTLNVTEKTGKIVAIKSVHEDDDLLISTSEGIMIRLAVSDMRVSGRATQGVKIIKLDDNDSIGDIAVVKNTDEEVSNEEISTEVIIPIIEDDITHIQNLTEEE